jgi:hypothetical protein
MNCWLTDLPMVTDPSFDDENDVAFDDGEVYFFATVVRKRLVIHEFVAKEPGLQGARTGLGRKTCETIRPYFREIVASGVGDEIPGAPLEEQAAYLFWKAMLDEGLVDEVIPTYGPSIRRSSRGPRP